jgi:cytochrome c biogenesis protein CcmG, thiol:disulfide interchange protein DsbE
MQDTTSTETPPPNPATNKPGTPRHPLVRLGVPVAAIAAIVAAILLLSKPWAESSDSESAELREARLGALTGGAPRVGEQAPDFVLRSLDGSVVRLSDLRGKVVLVNFWATWCGPCKAEMPDLQAVYEQHKDQLIVLAVNAESASVEETRRLVTDFRDELNLTFPIVLDTPEGAVFNQYKLQGLPDSFFVDRNGIIRSVSIGPMNKETILKKLEETQRAG